MKLESKTGTGLADKMQQKRQFKPTNITLWDNPKHPLYSISPDQQNREFLNSAIGELQRNLQSPAHFKFYASGSGGTMADSRKQLRRYQNALKFIDDYENGLIDFDSYEPKINEKNYDAFTMQNEPEDLEKLENEWGMK